MTGWLLTPMGPHFSKLQIRDSGRYCERPSLSYGPLVMRGRWPWDQLPVPSTGTSVPARALCRTPPSPKATVPTKTTPEYHHPPFTSIPPVFLDDQTRAPQPVLCLQTKSLQVDSTSPIRLESQMKVYTQNLFRKAGFIHSDKFFRGQKGPAFH